MKLMVETLRYIEGSRIEVVLKDGDSICHEDYAVMKVGKKNLLFCYVERGNSNCLFYDYSGLISLSSYLNNQTFSMIEYIDLLLNLSHSLKGLSRLKFNLNNLILKLEYIFIDPSSLELFFLNIPSQAIDLDYKKGYQQLFRSVVNFTRCSPVIPQYFELSTVIKSNFELDSLINGLDKIKKFKPKVLNSTFLSVVSIGSLTIIAGGIGYQYYLNQNILLTNSIYFISLAIVYSLVSLLILSACSIVKLKKIKRKKLLIIQIDKEIASNSKQQHEMIFEESISSSKAEIGFRDYQKNRQQNKKQTKEEHEDRASQNHIKSVSGYNPTDLLFEQEASHLCHTSNLNNSFKLLKAQTIIGRDRVNVDFCINDSTVSSIHAILKNQSGRYVLIDQGSTNGTFINNRRIESLREYQLGNQDIIRFSNQEYIFFQ